ncbi:hypothetical protein KC343_g7396 [Hortaea werneckii]|nr:hypothetical protein KC352_g16055 [Hortaea werneckii]KAI7563477.1 hypothetical protein KC317_g7705 [Hortaea werneckii]KAI7613613.1 hypothetical protein KC346_g7283 [Hortaea werneckii]KAI7623194.1 hypothetical protein KC343_g7396 [Hortaea werneckii]KAI7664795.1 hypothetical protein KC319_g7371 [Hortaea werneckii]
MPPRNLNTHPVTNLERFLVTRYRNAHELLETDVDAAEQGLLSLLTEPRLPIWMRAQCNMLLAAITEEYSEAMSFLRDARTSLQLFRERHDEVTPRMLQMEKDLDGIEEEIEERKETGFRSGNDSTAPTSRAASPSDSSGQRQESGFEASQREGTQPGDAQHDGLLLGSSETNQTQPSASRATAPSEAPGQLQGGRASASEQ